MDHEHLYHRVPNNLLTRWVVAFINRKMAQAGSRYQLRIRYRKPVAGHKYGAGGNLRSVHARKFSLYLVERPGSKARRIWRQQRVRARSLQAPQNGAWKPENEEALKGVM